MELLIIFSVVALLTGWLVVVLLRRERRSSNRTTHEDGRRIEAHARARFEDGPADRRALHGMGAYVNVKVRHDINRRY